MNKRQTNALALINSLARAIAIPNSRYVYMGRIVEFLSDIVSNPTDNAVARLVDYVDSSDKARYSDL